MAQDFPGSQFVGIDLSQRQIERGNQIIDQLQLDNIRLIHQSITEWDDDSKFDFILCHGVFSWVARDVQDAILQLGRQRLSANGLMYVSYNSLPGWHMRGMVREMLQYHADRFASVTERVSQARALLTLLSRSADHQTRSYGAMIREEAELLSNLSDAYLFHEHLEQTNDPLYLHEFVSRVEQTGLQYVGDADLPSMLSERFDQETQGVLADVSFVKQEQYMDFLRGRMFRCSILCHQQQVPNRDISPDRLGGISLRLTEAMQCESLDGGESRYTGATKTITSASSSLRSMLTQLSDSYPNWFAVEQLIPPELDAAGKGRALQELLHLLTRGVVASAVAPATFRTEVSALPATTPLARLQATCADTAVTTRLHRNLAVDASMRLLLELLDGTLSIAQLRAAYEAKLKQLRLDDAIANAVVDTTPYLEERLKFLAVNALLVH